jgi:ankyrin repeat protein
MDEDLIIATMEGDQAKVEALIALGADVNQKDDSGRTPLMAGVYKNLSFIGEVLIDAGADINDIDNEGFSVLYYAAVHGNFESTYMLYEREVKMNKTDPNFINILSATSENGHNHIVELLVVAEEKLNS